jgi:trehalose 6-phosphate synthase
MKLIIVSNRLPVSPRRTNSGFDYKHSSGGLATGLKSINTKIKFQWFGNLSSEGMSDSDKDVIRKDCNTKFNLHPIFIDPSLNEDSYNGFCNGILWPMLHYFSDDLVVTDKYYKAYLEYNEIFCKEILKETEDGDIIWVHDYHLTLLPKMIRDIKGDKVKLMFFLHTSFPSSISFNKLYCRREILEGILASDVVSFHSYEYVANFMDCIVKNNLEGIFYDVQDTKTLKKEDEKKISINRDKKEDEKKISINRDKKEDENINKKEQENINKNHKVSINAIPIGIDPNIFIDCINTEDTQKEIEYFREKFKGKKIILGVDRSDYIKGIPHRIQGYSQFLDKYPEYRDTSVFLQIGVPSRTGVKEYKGYTDCINRLVSDTNSTIGGIEKTNIYLLNDSVDFSTLCALYYVSNVLLVTSLRDGMNLVAMEYISCNFDTKGVLILSEFTGVSSTLPGSLSINPWNTEEICESIKTALEMDEEERIRRYEINNKNVSQFTSFRWAEENLSILGSSWEEDIKKE